VNFRDITERRAMEEQLRHHASHDGLTGLANRDLLFRCGTTAMERLGVTTGSVALLYCDLDGFKAINDSFGHGLGDQLLIDIARRIELTVRPQDVVARVGGDEFIVLADACDEAAALTIAERLMDAFRRPFEPDGRPFDIGVSIGYVVTDRAVAAATLLSQADAAMYAAKAGGGNRIVRFDNATLDRAVRARVLAGDLRLAVARDELHLVVQPIFRTTSLDLVGVEALVRWQHPDLGLVPPVEFIGLAEAQGLIGKIGRWVLDDACRTLAEWEPAETRPGWVSVNVSAHQLDEPDFASTVASCLTAHGLRPHELHIELTESAIATGKASRIERLHELRRLGVTISLDDFGTGYSSLSALNHVPLDVVKIDRSFVTGVGTTPDSTLMLRSIVDLAHALGYAVVAEGVEQRDELRILDEIGCDQVQGYLLGRPERRTNVEPSTSTPAPMSDIIHGAGASGTSTGGAPAERVSTGGS